MSNYTCNAKPSGPAQFVISPVA